jgi:hypothetical protein
MIIFFLIETYPAGQMTLWLKSLKNPDGTQQYSVALINTIPTAIQAIIAVTTFLTGSLAGLFNSWYIIAFIQGVNLFAVVVLRIWSVPNGLKFAAYFLLGFMGVRPLSTLPSMLARSDLTLWPLLYFPRRPTPSSSAGSTVSPGAAPRSAPSSSEPSSPSGRSFPLSLLARCRR